MPAYIATLRGINVSGQKIVEIYLHCPGGYGNTKLSNTALEKALSVGATTRNWKTVNTLFEMASKL